MSDHHNACLICGKPLNYYEKEQEMTCSICGGSFKSHASCEDRHYVCDTCHAKRGVDSIMEYCLRTESTNPIHMVQEMMDAPYIYMHGNEHHIMVGAALIAAYHNAGGAIDRKTALEEMKSRGSAYPGGSCGFWGCCGAAVSTGMFFSIVTGTTPLSKESWGLANRMTSQALEAIGNLGGPRCCKRNSFTAVKTAVKFTEVHLGIQMELPERITCHYFKGNRECLGKNCPYFPDK